MNKILNFFKKRKRMFLSGWDGKSIVDDKIKNGSIMSPCGKELDQILLREYVDIYVTLDDFKSSYPDIILNTFDKYPHKIDFIGFEKNVGSYSIFLGCDIKKEYNVQVLFCEICIEFNNPKLKSIVRNHKLNQII